MPAFKPKFAVPSQKLNQEKDDFGSDSAALGALSNLTNRIPQSSILKDCTNKSENSVKVCNLEDEKNMVKNNDCNLKKKCDDDEEQCEPTANNYDEVIDSVLKKAAAGTLFAENDAVTENTSVECDNTGVFQLSPNMAKIMNEVTPTTSPIDENASPVKLVKQRPVKKKPKWHETVHHKRKSLDYPSSQCVWVQCDNEICLKWRYLKSCSDPAALPQYWTCSMNTEDDAHNKCSDLEVDWSSYFDDDADHFVFTDYNAGSIIWAKMPGYPAWPAMVDSDPDTNLFYDYDAHGKVLRYHVVFLDDQVSRAWIPARSIHRYTSEFSKQFNQAKGRDFEVELQSGINRADEALQLSLEQRLERYNFEKRYLASGKRKEWTPRRAASKNREAKHSNQVVPNRGEEKESKTEVSRPASSDKKLNENKKESCNVPASENETKSSGNALAKPLFKAPKAKPVVPSKQSAPEEASCSPAPRSLAPSPPAAVVPSTTLKEMVAMKFDSDIYTMEMSEDDKHDNEPKRQRDDVSRNDTVGDELNSSSIQNEDFTGDFWQPQQVKKVSVEDDDPFVDLDVGAMERGGWNEDEMKELDELMPVISQHFPNTLQ